MSEQAKQEQGKAKNAPAGKKAYPKVRLSKEAFEAQKVLRHEINQGRKKQIKHNKKKTKEDVLSDDGISKLWTLTTTLYNEHLPKPAAATAARALSLIVKERSRLLDERQYSFKMPKDADGVTIRLGDIVEGDDGPLWRVEGYGLGSHPIMVSGPLRNDNTRRYVRMKPEWIHHVNDDRSSARIQRDFEKFEKIKADCEERGVEVPNRKFMGWHPGTNHEGKDDE